MRKPASPKVAAKKRTVAKRTAPGRPRATAAELAENRQAVIEVAERVYARTNYADVTVEDLITEARISRPTFYRWFANKDEVLEEIVRRANDALIASLQQAVAGHEDIVDKIHAGVDAYLKWGIDSGRRVPALYREANQHGSPVFKDRARVGKSMLMLYQHQGEMHHRDNIHPLVYQALIAATEYISSWLFSKRRHSEADVETARQVMLRVVLSTLAGPATTTA